MFWHVLIMDRLPRPLRGTFFALLTGAAGVGAAIDAAGAAGFGAAVDAAGAADVGAPPTLGTLFKVKTI